MSQFENSRRYSVPGGDGTTATINQQFAEGLTGKPISLKVNKQPVEKKRKAAPVSVSYSNESEAFILDTEFAHADSHQMKLDNTEDGAYFWLKAIKVLGLLVLAVGGVSMGAAWSAGNQYAAERWMDLGLMASTMAALGLGPFYAMFLTHHLEKGMYRGIGKYIAWIMVVILVLNEVGAMVSARNQSFGEWFMVYIGPYVLPVILVGVFLQLYFRASLKRTRDLVHMREKEKRLIAKNATDARAKKAKSDMRDRNLGQFGNLLSHWRVTFFNIIYTLFRGIVDDWRNSVALYEKQNKARAQKIKK